MTSFGKLAIDGQCIEWHVDDVDTDNDVNMYCACVITIE